MNILKFRISLITVKIHFRVVHTQDLKRLEKTSVTV